MNGRRNSNKQPFIQKGRLVGGWKLQKILGKGGNGEVWEVSKAGFANKAMKFLKKTNRSSYERFRSEVYVLSSMEEAGVVEIQKYNLPESLSWETPWFLMPKGIKCFEYLKGRKTVDTVEEFIKLAKTLSKLHKNDISHRDIKPANIIAINDRLCFADFGLVKYPGKSDVTASGRDIGAKYTMAPEMRREPEKHDGKAADVYSLAKSLWILLTKNAKGFDGQYVPSSNLSIKRFCKNDYVTSLENLLVKSTDNDPANRPSAIEFMEELIEWKNVSTDRHKRGIREWIDLHNNIFPAGAPRRASWGDIDSICSILNEIGKVGVLNHMFYPNGGGMDLLGASKAREKGMLALYTGGSTDIVKPRELFYESFGFDHHWNYFRLEIEEVTPILGGIEDSIVVEYLLEIRPGEYVEYCHWDNNEYEERELPPSARPITRFSGGAFVIFGKRSIYNLASGKLDAYDGRHNGMTAQNFRGYIEDYATKCREAGLDIDRL